MPRGGEINMINKAQGYLCIYIIFFIYVKKLNKCVNNHKITTISTTSRLPILLRYKNLATKMKRKIASSKPHLPFFLRMLY